MNIKKRNEIYDFVFNIIICLVPIIWALVMLANKTQRENEVELDLYYNRFLLFTIMVHIVYIGILFLIIK